MAYATTSLFRSLTHFTTSEVSDTDLTTLITYADKAIVRLTTTEVYLERLDGNIDDSNVDFKTKYSPLADTDASGTADKDDVSVYYATYDDTTHWIELGSAQTVTSIQADEGIITMETAPTNITAEAGVYAKYSYESKTILDTSLRNQAACYYLAYLVANKITGDTPNLHMIEDAPYIRKETVGADWLKLCFKILGLQDKVYLTRADGDSIDAGIPIEVSKRRD